MTYLSQVSILVRPPDVVARWRLIGSVTVLAAMLAIAVEHIYLISRTRWYESAHHLPLWSGFWYSAAAVAGVLVIVPVTLYVLRERPEYPGGFWLWVSVGVGYGIFVPILTGFFTPLASLMIDWSIGNVPTSSLPPWVIDRLLRGFFAMFVDGAPAIRHGLAAGVIVAAAGFGIDRMNAFGDRRVVALAPPLIALAVGVPIMLLALLGSPEFLRNLL